jgi:CubicO group peptidase (beta-lactamase class C family)
MEILGDNLNCLTKSRRLIGQNMAINWKGGFPLLIRILVCFTVSVVCLQAQLPDETAAAVDKLVAKALAESGTPAVSIAIIKDGKVAKAYGDARLDPKTSATAAMRFSVGSVSKQFLAGAILLAAEGGKL